VSDWLQEISHMQKSNVSVTGHLLASEKLCQ
jgi:hypothetical protein